MKIKDLPDSSKPRERFLKFGPEALSDAELFAIILRTGIHGENVIEVANRLVKGYELNKLFDCSLKELQQIKGIGPSKAMQILVISELNKRCSQSKNPVKNITCAKDVFDYFYEKIKNKKQEIFHVLILNSKNSVVGEELISKGTLEAALIDPREIFKFAIKNSASRIIIVHNHPSGDSEPSKEDIETTKRLTDSGELLGIKVLDHVIIGKDNYWSWRENLR